MDEVTLELQDGFFDDEVVASAEGMPELRLAGVTTKTQVNLAQMVKLPLPREARQLHLALPALGVARDVELPAERPLWIGVSLARAGPQLQVQTRSRPFEHR